MTQNDHSLAAADLRIPAVSVPPSQIPKPRTRICIKCGTVLPQDFPWTACDDCLPHIPRLGVGVPAAGQTLRVNQDMPHLGQSQQTFSTCVSCLMPTEVPKISPTLSSYCDLVCTPCRIRREGMKLKPTRRINLTATTATHPRPSLPLPNAFKPIRGPSYPSFFNSRGEFVVPPPVTVPIVNPRVMHDVAPVHVCMRYGCGARLAPNRLFNVCDECLRSGFGRGALMPPPPLKPRPKRIKRDERPSATLPWEAKRDMGTAQKAETLVQPPLGKSIEIGAGIGDSDLELMYPEDEGPAVQDCPDSAKMVDDAISCPEPTLGPERSMLVPLTPTTSARSPRSLPLKRTCETPGCGGTVSPSATWQRCYKCSLQRWKERQQTAIAAATVGSTSPAVSGHESKSGEAIDAHVPVSLEANVVDQMSMSRDAAPSHSPAPVLDAVDKVSSLELHNQQGATDAGEAARTSGTLDLGCDMDSGAEPKSTDVSSPWSGSDLTELSSEDVGVAERDSDSDAEDSSTIKIRIPVLASRLPNARVCAMKRCNIVLPPDYRWKICDSCRRYQRQYQRIRLEKARRRVEEFLQMEHEPADFGKPEIPLLEVQNNEKTSKGSRFCDVPRCRAILPESNIRWKSCRACRKRVHDDARRSSIGFLMDLEDPVEQSSSSDISPYPAFQNRSVLLSDLSAMLRQFVEAQILYLRAKLQTAGEKALSRLDPVLFAFDGEYSAVTGQRGRQDIDGQGKSDPDISQEAGMQEEVASVIEELNSALLTEFKPLESFTTQFGGVIARYTCGLELIVSLRPLPKAKDTDTTMIHVEGDTSSSHVPYMKPISGELEVAVVPDDSHCLWLGRRTIIRFRMLG